MCMLVFECTGWFSQRCTCWLCECVLLHYNSIQSYLLRESEMVPFFCFTCMQYVSGIGLTLFFWCLGGLSLTTYIIAHFNGMWIDRNWGFENQKLHNLIGHYWVVMVFFWIGDIVAVWVLVRLLSTTCAFSHSISVSYHFFRAACNLVAPPIPHRIV